MRRIFKPKKENDRLAWYEWLIVPIGVVGAGVAYILQKSEARQKKKQKELQKLQKQEILKAKRMREVIETIQQEGTKWRDEE